MNVTPTRKVTAAAAGAAFGEFIASVVTANTDIEGVTAASLSVIFAFLFGWLIPERG